MLYFARKKVSSNKYNKDGDNKNIDGSEQANNSNNSSTNKFVRPKKINYNMGGFGFCEISKYNYNTSVSYEIDKIYYFF